ncbi:MAG: hypothetical protein J7L58_03720 [Thermoplasmata archaeon]|nr:hypothetical protein [Thermoplasmata archaeon]
MERRIDADVDIAELIEFHEYFEGHNKNILDDVSLTLQKLDESKYAKKIRDHSKFLQLLKAIEDYNKGIEREAERVKEEATNVLLDYKLPEDYERFLLVIIDYYRMFSDIAFAVREIFWDLRKQFKIGGARKKGDEREEIYHAIIKDLEWLYKKMKKSTENMDQKNSQIIESIRKDVFSISKENIEELERMLRIIKKLVYRSEILHRYIFRFARRDEEEDEFSQDVKRAVRDGLKNII